MCALRSRLFTCQGTQGAHGDTRLNCTMGHNQVAEHGSDHAGEQGESLGGYWVKRRTAGEKANT